MVIRPAVDTERPQINPISQKILAFSIELDALQHFTDFKAETRRQELRDLIEYYRWVEATCF